MVALSVEYLGARVPSSLDIGRGYEEGNLLIVLWRANDARCQYVWPTFLKWRDAFVAKGRQE
jgi:hypothetical protein